MEKSLFEQMGGTYHREGEFLLPDIELPKEKHIGLWGQRHYKYLRNAKHILFSQLMISGKMNDYLADIYRQAEEMFSRLENSLPSMMASLKLSKPLTRWNGCDR